MDVVGAADRPRREVLPVSGDLDAERRWRRQEKQQGAGCRDSNQRPESSPPIHNR
jgi:hypothetical protein